MAHMRTIRFAYKTRTIPTLSCRRRLFLCQDVYVFILHNGFHCVEAAKIIILLSLAPRHRAFVFTLISAQANVVYYSVAFYFIYFLLLAKTMNRKWDAKTQLRPLFSFQPLCCSVFSSSLDTSTFCAHNDCIWLCAFANNRSDEMPTKIARDTVVHTTPHTIHESMRKIAADIDVIWICTSVTSQMIRTTITLTHSDAMLNVCEIERNSRRNKTYFPLNLTWREKKISVKKAVHQNALPLAVPFLQRSMWVAYNTKRCINWFVVFNHHLENKKKKN